MAIKPFLILQLRPERETADDEFAAFLRFGKLQPAEAHRIRMDQENIPQLNLADYSGVMVGGGPSNISDSPAKKSIAQKRFETELQPLLAQIIDADFPFLGACYGIGTLAVQLGGVVSKEKYSESAGPVTITLTKAAQNDPLTAGLPTSFRAFGGHKEACQDLPPTAVHLAQSEACPIQMIRVKRNMYGTQFHTELDSHGLEVRINAYKHLGYFPPEDAEQLIAEGHQETIEAPMHILERFVARYGAACNVH